MTGDPLRPDVSRLVLPRRPGQPTPHAPSFFPPGTRPAADPQAQPDLTPDPEECAWWGGAENPDTAPAGPTAGDTPFPEKKLSWPAAPGDEPVVNLQSSPCPCGAGMTIAGRSWCLKCGYDSDLDLLRRADAQLMTTAAVPQTQAARVRRKVWQSAPVFVLAVFGAAAIVAATIYRRELVPDRTDLRVWWTGIEALAGLFLYLAGHVTAVVLTVRYWDDPQPSSIDPWAVWRYALAYLPRTRWAFVLGLWGVTAFSCAFTLFWMNDYAFKDKTAKPPIRHIEVPPKPANTSGKTGDKDDGPAVIDVGSGTDRKPTDATPGSGPTATEAAPLAISRPQSATAVVIGYVPDTGDPSRVSKVALGIRGADGTIRFAGYADVDKGADTGSLTGLKRLAVAPDYVPDKGVVAVEPTLTADIRYADKDGQGVFRNSLLTGFAGEKKQP